MARVPFVFLVGWFTLAYGTLTEFETKFTRTLGPIQVNPGCKTSWCHNYTNGMLVYQEATGPSDMIHHMFSTIGTPTLLLSRTAKGANLTINYNDIKERNGEQAINYTKSPDHSLGFMFANLYEFNDTDDNADLSKAKQNVIARHSLANLNWTYSCTQETSDVHEIVLKGFSLNGSHPSFANSDSNINFKVRVDSMTGRLPVRPHMQFTSNSSLITIELNKLTTNSNWTGSRFAIEVVMFSTDELGRNTDATSISTDKSIDDEYSPGVFSMFNWEANNTKLRSQAWGYAQWKPVSYSQSTRGNSQIIKATTYPFNTTEDKTALINRLPKYGLFEFYFGSSYSQISMNATKVSFGSIEDGFYAATGYTVWTMGVGMGPRPTDDVSIMVILIIAVGLGIPLILMVVSVVYVCLKSRKRKLESGYQTINS